MNVNDYFKYKKRVVVKIGSSSLQHPQTGSMNLMKIEKLVRELCDLRNQGMDVCLVSSGAIAVGRQAIGLQSRPQDISTKQACAAVGQARLMMTYQRMFAEYNQTAGQILMTKDTILEDESRQNAHNTFEEMFLVLFRLLMKMIPYLLMRCILVIMIHFLRLYLLWLAQTC